MTNKLISIFAVLLLIIVSASTAAEARGETQIRLMVPGDAVQIPPLAMHLETAKTGAITVIVGLNPPDIQGLNKEITMLEQAGSPVYHHWLTPSEFESRFSPSNSTVEAVAAYMEAHGAKLVSVSQNRFLLTFEMSPSAAHSALGVNIENFEINGKQYYTSTSSPSLPATIAPMVSGIEGLQDYVQAAHPSVQLLTENANYVPPSGPDASPPYNPATIHIAYNFTGIYNKGYGGQGVSLSIVTAYGFDNATVGNFFSSFGISEPRINVLEPDGSVNRTGLETTLDLEWMGSTVPNATINVVEGANAQLSTFTSLFAYVIDHNISSVISTSWGTPESETPNSVLINDNTLFKQATAEGISVLVASGDNGAYDKTSSPTPDFPASSPYVTAVGGTWLNLSSSAGKVVRSSETGWNQSGGGVSAVFAEPQYQEIPNAYNLGGRGVPDVALDAEPNAGYFVYFNGTWDEAGGTSFGAPIWAGILGLENEIRTNHGEGDLGLANVLLYKIANSTLYSQAFYEISVGYNGYYYAQPGYNMVTGLGTPNVYNLLMLLASVPIVPLSVNVTATPTWGDAPLITSLYAAVSGGFPPYTVEWLLNGAAVGNGSILLEKMTTPGTYHFIAVVRDNVSDSIDGYANITVFSFSSPESVNLSAIPSAGDANLTVNFTDKPSGLPVIYYVLWAFGDGQTSNVSQQLTAEHTYVHGNTYIALSTVFVSDGSAPRGFYTMQSNTTVYVAAHLRAEILSSRFGGSYPLYLKFTASQSGGTSPFTYDWTYSNQSGSFSSASTSIFVNYTQVGVYPLSLTVHDKYGRVSAVSKDIHVYSPMVVTISVSPSTSGVAPFNASFSANVTGGAGGYLYRWHFGSTVESGNPVSYVFTQGGTMNVTLTVTDLAGDTVHSNVTVHVQSLGLLNLLKGITALVILAVAIIIAAVISYVISRRRAQSR
ncbi:MAG: protease pro-enzyme activation domain-containing protein [Methanomassiliicoccales archaeon]